MSAPRRWKDTHDAPIGVRELLSAAPRPRPIDDRSLARGAERVTRLGVAPVAVATGAALSLWVKLAAAAAVGVCGIGAAVVVQHVTRSDPAKDVRDTSERGGHDGRGAKSDPGASSATAVIASASNPQAPSASDLADVVGEPVENATALRPGDGAGTSSAPAGPTKGTVVAPPSGSPAFARTRARSIADRDAPFSLEGSAPEPMRAPSAPALVASTRAPAPMRAPSTPALVASTRAPEGPATPQRPRAVATLAEEVALLQEARASLETDPNASLGRAALHRRRYPSGILGAERDLIELDALRRAGRVEEARARAQSWLTREPSGIHASRVRTILESLDRSARP